MSDGSPQNEDGQESQPIGPEHTDNIELKEEIVQKMQQLLSQDKIVVIAEVVNLTVKNRSLQKENNWVQQIMRKEMEEKQMMQKTLLSQQECFSFVEELELQRKSIVSTLTEEFKNVSTQLQMFDKIRVQLKTDVVTGKVSLDKLQNRVIELEEKACKQADEHKSFVERSTATESNLQGTIDKLIDELKAKEHHHTTVCSNYDSTIKKLEDEVRTLVDELELERVDNETRKETVDKQKASLDQLECANRELTAQLEQLKAESDRAVSKLQVELNKEQEMRGKMEEQCLAAEKEISHWKDNAKQAQEEIEQQVKLKEKLEQDNSEVRDRLTNALMQVELCKEQHAAPKKKSRFFQTFDCQEEKDPASAESKITEKTDNFDWDCIESFHHDNEMSTTSLLSSPVTKYNRNRRTE